MVIRAQIGPLSFGESLAMMPSMTPTSPVVPTVLITANRAVVYGAVSRWLLHDLRNPTQALSLVAELFDENEADPDPDIHAMLQESTRKLAACLEMLDRTLRTIPPRATPGPVVLTEVFGFLAQLYQTCRSSTRLDLSPLLGKPLPAVSAVEDYLEHAFLNLLMNAMEAIGDREDGQITVTATERPGQVELVIDDNGPGIPAAEADRIFEPYVTTKAASFRASGLGLPVARHLIQLSGGTLAYAPKSSPGARFVVQLLPWPTAKR